MQVDNTDADANAGLAENRSKWGKYEAREHKGRTDYRMRQVGINEEG